jgi:hypothetical protein
MNDVPTPSASLHGILPQADAHTLTRTPHGTNFRPGEAAGWDTNVERSMFAIRLPEPRILTPDNS